MLTPADVAALALAAVYLLDRLIKAELIGHFFARPAPPAPTPWPSVTLIQPVTRGATNLEAHLAARAALSYPGPLQHVAACDAADADSQRVCRALLPSGAEVVTVAPDLAGSPVASKVAKMTAGVARATGEVLCFVDDDILLPPEAVCTLVAHLDEPGAGASFGLACQDSYATPWEEMMSHFVNSNGLTGYVPLTFFVEPYTITGHVFALRRAVFDAGGGMAGLAGRFDDDHEIARRVRAQGLRCVQTPLVYRVENALPSLRAYLVQTRRWFVMPRQAMMPHLTAREWAASALLSAGNLLPSLLLLLALAAPSWVTWACIVAALAAFLACYHWCRRYAGGDTRPWRWGALLWTLFGSPLHVLLALLLPGDRIEWRGQAYRARRGGAMEPVPEGP